MKYKRLIISILSILLVGGNESRADIFDEPQDNDQFNEAVTKDTSGFYYRTGLDYNVHPVARDPQVYSNQSLSLGCSGFDFDTSFLNQFSSQALSDTLTTLASETMSAAPLLLLEYVSPTLADIVKHFDAITNLRLGLRYAQCEDIEQALGDKLDQLRKKSEMECIKNKPYDDIDKAMAECKSQSDPFAFLKDENGDPLWQGGSINVLQEALNRINIPQEDKDFALETIPETIITKDGYEHQEPEKNFKETMEDSREEYLQSLETLLTKYLETQSVSEEELDSFSIPGVPLTEYQLKNIALLGPSVRYLALAKLASQLAYWKTLSRYQENLAVLREAMTHPMTEEGQKDILKDKYAYIQEEIAKIKNEREFLKEYTEVMTSVLEEADKERLRVLALEDGTKNYRLKEAQEEEKRFLMLP